MSPMIQIFLTDMDIPDAVSFLLLIAYIIDEKELEAKSLLDISGGKNVWEKYYSAYLDVKNGRLRRRHGTIQ